MCSAKKGLLSGAVEADTWQAWAWTASKLHADEIYPIGGAGARERAISADHLAAPLTPGWKWLERGW